MTATNGVRVIIKGNHNSLFCKVVERLRSQKKGSENAKLKGSLYYNVFPLESQVKALRFSRRYAIIRTKKNRKREHEQRIFFL